MISFARRGAGSQSLDEMHPSMSHGPLEAPDDRSAPDSSSDAAPAKPKLPVVAHFLCGWPLIMVAFGGAIGGGLGGGAYGINIAIYKSALPIVLKIVLNITTGIAAFVIWFAIAAAIHLGRN